MTNLTGAKYPKPIQDRCLLYPKRVKHVRRENIPCLSAQRSTTGTLTVESLIARCRPKHQISRAV